MGAGRALRRRVLRHDMGGRRGRMLARHFEGWAIFGRAGGRYLLFRAGLY